MATQDNLRLFFVEHATQARRHEDLRERSTALVLTLAGALIGLITFAKLAIWSWPAAALIIILGLYGLLFSAKHYERARMHTEILRHIRIEIDKGESSTLSLSDLTKNGRNDHYKDFRWPVLSSGDPTQQRAKSRIARLRLNMFWDGIHVVVLTIGIGLTAATILGDTRTDELDLFAAKSPKSEVRSPQPDTKEKSSSDASPSKIEALPK